MSSKASGEEVWLSAWVSGSTLIFIAAPRYQPIAPPAAKASAAHSQPRPCGVISQNKRIASAR